MDYFLDPFRKFKDFSGRATRKQFWIPAVINFLIIYLLSGLDVLLGTRSIQGQGYISSLYSLITLLPMIALGVRRLHDTNRSGWWYLFTLVPIVGPITVLIFFGKPSQAGPNKYDPQPAPVSQI